MEIGCCKYPSSSSLQQIWLENKVSLIEYIKLANTGIRGIILFENKLPAAYVTVKIGNREPYFKTNENGKYY